MRIVLERSDLLRILGKHFDFTVDDRKVVIRSDPFEVELMGIPLPDSDPAYAAPPAAATAPAQEPEADPTLALRRADADATTEMPEPGADGITTDSEGVPLHPATYLEMSKRLTEELDLQNPSLGRGRQGGSLTMPTYSDDEI